MTNDMVDRFSADKDPAKTSNFLTNRSLFTAFSSVDGAFSSHFTAFSSASEGFDVGCGVG